MFVYGTLMSPFTREHFNLDAKGERKATLPGFKKHGLNVLEAPGEWVDGLYFLIGDGDLEKLDRYEGTPTLYKRITASVEVDGKYHEANVYQLNPRIDGLDIVGIEDDEE